MSPIQLTCFAFVIVFGLTQAQCPGRIRTVIPVQATVSSDASDDLSTILQLVKALKDLDSEPVKTPQPSSCGINAEDIITKLINALIYATVGGKTNSRLSSNMISGANGNGLIGLDLSGNNVSPNVSVGGSGSGTGSSGTGDAVGNLVNGLVGGLL